MFINVQGRNYNMSKPFLFVGLDYEDLNEAASFAEELTQVDRTNFGFKLNLDFILNTALLGDRKPFERVLNLGRPIFADLKMWNGKRTMTSIVDGLTKKGVDYFNVYSLADRPFLETVVESTKGTKMKVLGVTVLTHYNEDYCQRMRGCSLRDAVRKDAEVAYSVGCHGIILPGTILDVVSDLNIEKLVPAVRPSWYGKTGDNYQEQETFVRDAISGGANLLVCSSPIRKSKDRKEALIKTLDEMA